MKEKKNVLIIALLVATTASPAACNATAAAVSLASLSDPTHSSSVPTKPLSKAAS